LIVTQTGVELKPFWLDRFDKAIQREEAARHK
jgi:hypothetical protein